MWISEKSDTFRKLPLQNFTLNTHPKVRKVCEMLGLSGRIVLFQYFQEFKSAMTKLRKAYYGNATTTDEIMRGNIAYTSDLNTRDKILQAVVYQAMANNKGTDTSQHRNTFLIR